MDENLNYKNNIILDGEFTFTDVKYWRPIKIYWWIEWNGFSKYSKLFKWRIENTEKIFQIENEFLIEYWKEDYYGFLKRFLEDFAENYISWKRLKFSEKWMKMYKDMFEKYLMV